MTTENGKLKMIRLWDGSENRVIINLNLIQKIYFLI